MKQDPLRDVPVTGDISREHWRMLVPGLHPEANATIELTARADGTATLRITCDTAKGSSQRIVLLDVTTAAQLSTGIWEAAGLAQQLARRLGGDRPPPPRPPRQSTGSGEPGSRLRIAPSPRGTVARRRTWGSGEEPASVNGAAAVDAEDVRTIGWRLRRIRDSRGKSLRVIAGLAGMSSSTLHRIEHGQRAVTLSEIVALANALEIAPSELTKLPVPAPANGHTDSTTEAVRLALDAIEVGRPGGLVLPVAVLRDQVARIPRPAPGLPVRRRRHRPARADPQPAHHPGHRHRPRRAARPGRLPARARHPPMAVPSGGARRPGPP
ncbi:MAG: helix-turn-helix domain-containing protein, partial [Pseudonocardiaceae bacterium]